MNAGHKEFHSVLFNEHEQCSYTDFENLMSRARYFFPYPFLDFEFFSYFYISL